MFLFLSLSGFKFRVKEQSADPIRGLTVLSKTDYFRRILVLKCLLLLFNSLPFFVIRLGDD